MTFVFRQAWKRAVASSISAFHGRLDLRAGLEAGEAAGRSAAGEGRGEAEALGERRGERAAEAVARRRRVDGRDRQRRRGAADAAGPADHAVRAQRDDGGDAARCVDRRGRCRPANASIPMAWPTTSASCSLTTRTSRQGQRASAMGPAGAAFRMTLAPAARARRAAMIASCSEDLALQQEDVADADSVSRSIWSARTWRLAPDATTMAFSPWSSTAMKAAPVGEADGRDAGADRRRRCAAAPARCRRKGPVADRADERDVRPGAACCERLVGALAAGDHGIVRAQCRLARPRDARHAGDEVDVHRSEDDDHARLAPLSA